MSGILDLDRVRAHLATSTDRTIGVLTAETFAAAMVAVIEDRGELLCPPHVVAAKDADRLRAEGGSAFCGACMRPFHVAPPSER